MQLFKRLENFYLRWCDGEFIDALEDNYPQKKMRQQKGQGIRLGVRQVDVYAGLNVMILLLELHRYAQLRCDLKNTIIFYLCGQAETEGFDESRLLRIIGYTFCISGVAYGPETVFERVVGPFLSNVSLNKARLPATDFQKANLTGARLSDVKFTLAYFQGTNLSSADLSKANLYNAILSNTNLNGTNLRGTDLTGINLKGADLENISWDENTKWEDVKGLETAVNVPEALKQQLGLG